MTIVLVTGGAGYIGSHTCKALATAGVTPVSFDTLEHGHRDAVRWGPLVVGDTRDRGQFLAALAEFKPAAIIHFAAYAYVGESIADPAKYYQNNLTGALNVIECCRLAGIDKLIFSSSCATYGIPDHLPIRENAPQRPISPYGRSKLMVEQILIDYAMAYDFRHIALRYFNAAGADPDGTLHERHDPETHLIPRALMAAAGTIPYLEVFGDDHPTPDGTCIRDYIHVTDLADAHVSAVRDLVGGGQSVALNIGAGHGTSIRQILVAIASVTGRAVPVRFSARRPGDPAVLFADAELARHRLGFLARQSEIETIIRTAAPHFGLHDLK